MKTTAQVLVEKGVLPAAKRCPRCEWALPIQAFLTRFDAENPYSPYRAKYFAKPRPYCNACTTNYHRSRYEASIGGAENRVHPVPTHRRRPYRVREAPVVAVLR